MALCDLSTRLSMAEACSFTHLCRQDTKHQGRSRLHLFCRGQVAQGGRDMQFLCIDMPSRQKRSVTQAVSGQRWAMWSSVPSLSFCPCAWSPGLRRLQMGWFKPLGMCEWDSPAAAKSPQSTRTSSPLASVGQRLPLPLTGWYITCESDLQWATQDCWQIFTDSRDGGRPA